MNENKKISQLEVAAESKNTDIIPIVQDRTNKQVTKEVLLGDVYRKTEVDAKINGKADKATTLEGYGITDAYTKNQADTKFITKAVDDLVNYYVKSEVYTKAEVNALVDTIPKFAITLVDSLPTKNISTTTIYLVRSDDEGDNIFTEYIYVNNKWEILGSQKIDITNYYTKEEVDNLLNNIDLANYYDKAAVDELLAEKASKSIIAIGEDEVTEDTKIIIEDDEFNNIGSEVYVGPTEPVTKEKVWIQKGKNLFNKDSILLCQELKSETGLSAYNSSWYVTDFIKIKANTKYYLSCDAGRTYGNTNAFYDENMNFIGFKSGINGLIETPNNAVYIRFNGRLSELESNIQLEEGSVATSYEEYIQRKIYTIDNNGKYIEVSREPDYGKLLWFNKDASLDFEEKEVTLKNGNFKKLEFIIKANTSMNEYFQEYCQRGSALRVQMLSSFSRNHWVRSVSYVDETHYLFANCNQVGDAVTDPLGYTTANTSLIPVAIKGYE